MFRLTWGRLGGSITRRRVTAGGKATAAALPSSPRVRKGSVQRRASSKPSRQTSTSRSPARTPPTKRTKSPPGRKPKDTAGPAKAKAKTAVAAQVAASEKGSDALVASSSGAASGKKAAEQAPEPARPAYMSAKREEEVLTMAERMQRRDLTTEVPVASFAYEILKTHPSVRDMGLRERMDFLLNRWSRLNSNKRLEYINDPLRGLL